MILFLICIYLWWIALKKRKEPMPSKSVDPQQVLDAEHYKSQLDLYYEQLWEAESYLEKAREAIKVDNELNKYGSVVRDKVCEQHHKDYQKWLNKVATINNKIHTTERRLNKCL